jgi:hypothetical protein
MDGPRLRDRLAATRDAIGTAAADLFEELRKARFGLEGADSVSSPFPGAYQIQFRPRVDLVPACTWVSQEYLGQIRVSSPAAIGTDSFSLRMP